MVGVSLLSLEMLFVVLIQYNGYRPSIYSIFPVVKIHKLQMSQQSTLLSGPEVGHVRTRTIIHFSYTELQSVNARSFIKAGCVQSFINRIRQYTTLRKFKVKSSFVINC